MRIQRLAAEIPWADLQPIYDQIGTHLEGVRDKISKRIRMSMMKQQIMFKTPEYACVHEAGHAVTALSVGATVVEMKLYREPQRSYGRTRVDRTEDQAPHIALGGFAAEYLLYVADRLLKEDGALPTEKEFIDYAYRNAVDDFKLFWTYHAGSSDPITLGIDQREMDDKFIKYAVGRAKNEMSLELVEHVADALLAANTLGQCDIIQAFTQSQ